MVVVRYEADPVVVLHRTTQAPSASIWLDLARKVPDASPLIDVHAERMPAQPDITTSATPGVIAALNDIIAAQRARIAELENPPDKWVGGGWKNIAAELSDALGRIWTDNATRMWFTRHGLPAWKRENEIGKPEYNVAAIIRALRGT